MAYNEGCPYYNARYKNTKLAVAVEPVPEEPPVTHLCQKQRQQSQDNEIGATSKVGQLVQLESGSYREEHQLQCHCYNGADSQVVLV
jgi:hypothetical protein